MSYFNKILIANRGEIARRIIRTCNRLGIETVAVHSDIDKDAPYVKEATEAVHIGENQVQKSYLDMEKIIEAAKSTNADAIHPGFGFLSENPDFVERCEQEGITFIGPTAEVMRKMGSKLEARTEMAKAGVPVVPGSPHHLESLEHAEEIAADLGFPLMLKASSGGGGIGMKLLESVEDLKKNFESVKKQAKQFFNDDAVFLEKLIAEPRHIEVQIAADHHGNIVHLYERECSVQRRHQKVIEESPSPFLTEEKRKELTDAAVVGAKHIGYTNVGTVEFIFDEDGNFYFLEMNTRLQVEHPVTEEITELDLVEWQLQIAANENLPMKQEEITRHGHAMEFRVYAEDPETFFPSPGTIETLHLPDGEVRYEFGVEEKSVVSPFYDPMIGKIIVHRETREKTIEASKEILANIELSGIKTNIPLHAKILTNPSFVSGNYTTKLLQ